MPETSNGFSSLRKASISVMLHSWEEEFPLSLEISFPALQPQKESLWLLTCARGSLTSLCFATLFVLLVRPACVYPVTSILHAFCLKICRWSLHLGRPSWHLSLCVPKQADPTCPGAPLYFVFTSVFLAIQFLGWFVCLFFCCFWAMGFCLLRRHMNNVWHLLHDCNMAYNQ